MPRAIPVLIYLSCLSYERCLAISHRSPSFTHKRDNIALRGLARLLLVVRRGRASLQRNVGSRQALRMSGIHSPRMTTFSRRMIAVGTTSLPVLAHAKVSKQPSVMLNSGDRFPTASFGLQVCSDDEAEALTLLALDVGFRSFFAPDVAHNQRGFAKAIQKSGIPREELFICGSVLSNNVTGFDQAYKLTAAGCQENMNAFSSGGIEYVDMIMLDYACRDDESIRGQWKALEEMYKSGLTRLLAVSNFSPGQLDVILEDKMAIVPVVNQLVYGVGFNFGVGWSGFSASEIVEENRKRGVVVQAFSPLFKALKGGKKQACEEIGEKYGKSVAQVALRWIVDTGCTFTTQTKVRQHFVEDIDIFDFMLTRNEIARLASL